MGSRNVLLVEDDLTLGELIVYVMTRRGYTVTWYVRARFIQDPTSPKNPPQLVFMTDRGLESVFSKSDSAYDFALVDSRLKGSSLEGVDVTRALTAASVTVIACSGLHWLNDELIKAGAIAGIEKHDIFTRVRDNEDFLQAVLHPPAKAPSGSHKK